MTEFVPSLHELQTPCLLLKEHVLQRNIDRMEARAAALGVALRPHMKTCKAIEVARRFRTQGEAAIAVSTLKEAEFFFEHGIRDIQYAVGIVPGKLARVARLNARGARVQLILDAVETARSVAEFGAEQGVVFDVLIEVDTDGHRGGVRPRDAGLPTIARLIAASPALRLRGVMTHAGEAYECAGPEAIAAHAERERSQCVDAAGIVRDLGLPCPVVSVGSTPTATFARSLEGVTEMRPGNFVFFDLFQAGLGVCRAEDIAVRVLASVVGQDPRHNRFFIDAGGLALSKDQGTGSQAVDQRFGWVEGSELTEGEAGGGEDLVVVGANQEHGVVSRRDGQPIDFRRVPIGAKVSVVPVHACMTCAAHDGYHVVNADGELTGFWRRCNGW